MKIAIAIATTGRPAIVGDALTRFMRLDRKADSFLSLAHRGRTRRQIYIMHGLRFRRPRVRARSAIMLSISSTATRM